MGAHGPASVRFWRLVDQPDPDGCWPWRGRRTKRGYGMFHVMVDGKDRSTGAHRFAYADRLGRIPDGLFVLHRCDNPPCCNPAHLFLGTQDDNMQDAAVKGRLSGPGLRGEAHPNFRTHCKRGHALLGENVLLKDGRRKGCRECSRQASADRLAAHREENRRRCRERYHRLKTASAGR